MLHNYSLFYNIALATYLVTTILLFIQVISSNKLIMIINKIGLIIGFVLLTISLVGRGVAAGHVPFSNTYETLIFFAWLMALIYFPLRKKDEKGIIATGVSLLIMVTIAVSSLVVDVPRPLVPALQSNWLTIHVVFMFISYAAFAIAFITAILYLIFKDRFSIDFDKLTYQNIMFGVPFLTLGIFTGAVWANRAWGTYWGWDPKETWSLITWFVYAIYLHARYMKGWRGTKSVWIAVVGFPVVVFTYFGVNYLLSGLHSYG